jgi:hypothetical protein
MITILPYTTRHMRDEAQYINITGGFFLSVGKCKMFKPGLGPGPLLKSSVEIPDKGCCYCQFAMLTSGIRLLLFQVLPYYNRVDSEQSF